MPAAPRVEPFVRTLTRVRPVRDNELAKRFLREHPYCMACGMDYERAARERWPGLAFHHLLGGSARSDEACNGLVLCEREHSLRHGARIRVGGELLPALTLGMTLTLKRERDPGNYDPGRLEALWARALPDEEELPEFLVQEWQRRRGVYG